MTFRDRSHAGALLAARLDDLRAARPVVLGLARGGVAVAREVADRLAAPLDVMVVRKVGAPGAEEYALGAIAEGGGLYLNRDAVRRLGLAERTISALVERQLPEVSRRVGMYRGGREPLDVAGRTAIVVDDGVATGATARAACRAARARGAAAVVLAAPVVAAQSEPELRAEFDDVVAVELPEQLVAVSRWYGDFREVTDEDVVACLDRDEDPADPAAAPGLWDGEWNEPVDEDAAPAIPLAVSEEVRIPVLLGGRRLGALAASLAMPPRPRGLVFLVRASASGDRAWGEERVARALHEAGVATLRLDLLTADEAERDADVGELRLDVELLAQRILEATRWAAEGLATRRLPVGYLGAGAAAAAALVAAAALHDRVTAVASCGGRPDLVPAEMLEEVTAPVLLLVGERDEGLLEENRRAAGQLRSATLAVVPRSQRFEEPGALAAAARSAAGFFDGHFAAAAAPEVTPRTGY